jgi:hypothetical protein
MDVLPERDPWFRIAVLERRERFLWKRRMRLAIVAVAAITLALSLAFTAVSNASADYIDSWLFQEPETFFLALAAVATACLALLSAWLRQRNAVRAFFEAWTARFWV